VLLTVISNNFSSDLELQIICSVLYEVHKYNFACVLRNTQDLSLVSVDKHAIQITTLFLLCFVFIDKGKSLIYTCILKTVYDLALSPEELNLTLNINRICKFVNWVLQSK
jgi:hypothetical protein